MEYMEGTYQYYDGSQIKCKFLKNIPQADDLLFTDPDGVQWDNVIDKNMLIIRHVNTFKINE